MATVPKYELREEAPAQAGAMILSGALTEIQLEQARNPRRPIREVLEALEAREDMVAAYQW